MDQLLTKSGVKHIRSRTQDQRDIENDFQRRKERIELEERELALRSKRLELDFKEEVLKERISAMSKGKKRAIDIEGRLKTYSNLELLAN